MAHEYRSDLSKLLVNVPFAIATDGSNDADSKLFPVVLSYFDPSVDRISSSLLSVPVLQGSATGVNIGNLVLDTV